MNYELLFPLLILYQFKHLAADYFLQRGYMLRKFLPGWDFALPLLAHVGVHAGFTFLIALVVTGSPSVALGLALFDATIHFMMDRLKAGPKYMGRWKALSSREYPLVRDNYAWYVGQKNASVTVEDCESALRGNTFFWWSLGFDQMVHHLTHYTIIWYLVSR